MAALEPVIYAITNSDTGDMYIGSAVNYQRRWQKHANDLKNKRHHSQRLQRAYNKYGDRFEYSFIEFVDKRTIAEREQFWLNFFRPTYNIAKNVSAPMLGRKHSDDTRAKMAEAHRGKKRPPRAEEWKARISDGKTGKKMSEQGRLSMIKKKAILFSNPEYRARWAACRVAQLHSPENAVKRALAMRGNTNAKGFKYPPEAYASRRRKNKESAS